MKYEIRNYLNLFMNGVEELEGNRDGGPCTVSISRHDTSRFVPLDKHPQRVQVTRV